MCLGSLGESAVYRSRIVSNFVIIYFDWAYAEPPTSLASILLEHFVLKLFSNEYFKSELMNFISSILAIKSTPAGITVISRVVLVLFQGNFVTTTYPWNKTGATPEMTGIPADVLLMAKMEDMEVIISDLKYLLEKRFQDNIGQRDLCQGSRGFRVCPVKRYYDKVGYSSAALNCNLIK